MATYKKVNTTELNSNLSAIADTIRSKTGESELLKFPEEFVESIEKIPTIDPVFYAYMNKTITEFNNDTITNIGDESFSYCRSLETVNVPNVLVLNNNAFSRCPSLKNINIPNVRSIGSHAFYECSSLSAIKFYWPVAFLQYTFGYCGLLKTLIFCVSDDLVRLNDSYAFVGSPFNTDGTGGIVLVPRSMIESYQTATNWSVFYEAGTCLFWPIEDYTLDGSILGEIDWDKLNTDKEGAFATA